MPATETIKQAEKRRQAIANAAAKNGFAIIDTRWLSVAFIVMLGLLVSVGFLAVALYSLQAQTQRIGRCNMEQVLEHRVANQTYHDLFVAPARKLDPTITAPSLKEALPPSLESIEAAHKRLVAECADLLPAEVLESTRTPMTEPVP